MTALLLFLSLGAALAALLWSGYELFVNQEDPLGDRLEVLQEHAMASPTSARRRGGGGFLNSFLYVISLVPGGEGWLILSDIAEHLGLRTRADLMAAFESAGLKVIDRVDARPRHPKASDASDPLHAARSAEVTSLWRLGAGQASTS